ncbi:hypothetical protein U1Q18_027987 [Sarracenia purpurea var. burkii]
MSVSYFLYFVDLYAALSLHAGTVLGSPWAEALGLDPEGSLCLSRLLIVGRVFGLLLVAGYRRPGASWAVFGFDVLFSSSLLLLFKLVKSFFFGFVAAV